MSNTAGSKGATFPGDLVLVAILGVTTAAIGSLGLSGLAGQMVLGTLGVLFAPGYALIALLFPEEASTHDHRDTTAVQGTTGGLVGNGRKLSTVERVLLAIGTSVCLVPLTGIGVAFTPWQVGPAPVLGTTGAGTTVLAAGAIVVRRRVPPQERFSPRIVGFPWDDRGRFRTGDSGSILTILLVVGIVVAAGGVGIATLTTERGERFTEFYLVTENGTTEEVLGARYSEAIAQSEEERIKLGITNREGRATSYTVVVLLQSFGEDETVREVERLDTFSTSVGAGETWERSHNVSPEMTGENLRLTYLLYDGSAPDDPAPTVASAYRTTHIWLDAPP